VLSDAKQFVANTLARLAMMFPVVERLLVAGGHRPFLRRHLRLGAVALGYPRVLGKRELRIAQMEGYSFWVNVGESLGVGPYFFGDSGTVWFTRALLKPGDTCVDAGANTGHYTFLCASVIGSTGRVFAFEPNPEFAILLRQSVALNHVESIVHLSTDALWSASNETKAFYLSIEPTNSGTSSLMEHGLFLSPEHQIRVQTIRFDDFAERARIEQFRLVKIDVERAEDHLLEGAKRTLRAHKVDYLIVEMYSGGRAQTLLQSAGYEGYFITDQKHDLVPLASIPDGLFGDYLFVRPGLGLPQS
jgi:FkbM family methyltransferase